MDSYDQAFLLLLQLLVSALNIRSAQHLHPSSSNSWFLSFISKLLLGISCFHRTLLSAECQVVILQSQLVPIYKQGQLDSVIYTPEAFSFSRGASDVMY